MRFGSSQVEDWLNTIGFFRTDTDTLNTSEADDYIQLWIQEYPLYQDNIFAVIGGWHNPWPDGDWGELLDEKLMFWILQDAEPWFEVWETSHGLKILQRFT